MSLLWGSGWAYSWSLSMSLLWGSSWRNSPGSEEGTACVVFMGCKVLNFVERGLVGVSFSDRSELCGIYRLRVAERSFLGDVLGADGVIWTLLKARPSSRMNRIVADLSSSSSEINCHCKLSSWNGKSLSKAMNVFFEMQASPRRMLVAWLNVVRVYWIGHPYCWGLEVAQSKKFSAICKSDKRLWRDQRSRSSKLTAACFVFAGLGRFRYQLLIFAWKNILTKRSSIARQ